MDMVLILTVEVVKCYLQHNALDYREIPAFIRQTYAALDFGQEQFDRSESKFLSCLECGRSFKILKKHLHHAHMLSPEAYRMRHGLPADLPLVAHDTSQRRREIAQQRRPA